MADANTPPAPDNTSHNQRVLQVLHSSEAAVFLLDRAGTVLFENPSAQSLRGQEELSAHALFRGPAFSQVLQVRHWDCIELSPSPERLGHLHPVALVFDLGHASISATTHSPTGTILLIIPPHSHEQSSLAEREEFLATAAHDLKNPLSAMFGYADALLETRAAGSLTDTTRSILSKIRGTAARAIELVRNYQHLAELAAHKLRYSGTPTDCVASIRTVVDEAFREDPAAHQVKVIAGPEPLLVHIDKLPLERVLMNLFLNAVRYTPKGGVVTLRAERRGPSAIITIHNTGSLIPEAEIPKLFGRRYRGSTSAGTSGTGLGLYIAKGIVTQAGGQISAQSSLEAGTTFTVELKSSS